ncbi:ABC transporter permease [Citricoccus sp. NPDC079358]|nr:ABC transporter permease [Citricoccus muralis]
MTPAPERAVGPPLASPGASQGAVRATRNRRGRLVGVLVGRRLAWTVPLLAVISLGIFALAALSPADATTGFLGARGEFTPASSRDNVEELLGHGTWLESWLAWAGSTLTGDPGWSTAYRAPVAEIVAARLPWTVLIMATGVLSAAVLSVVLALGVALTPHHPVSRTVVGGLWAVTALPSFLVSLGLMAVFAIGLGWLPAGGLTNPGADLTAGQVATHMVLPTAAVAVSQVPWMSLHLHEALRAQLNGPAVEAARVRGLSEPTIVARHALPAAAIPVVAIAGTRLPEIVAGAAVVELVLSWPGLGQALVEAALAQDLALLATVGVLLTAASLLGGLLADVALVALDPRTDPREL